MASAPTRGICNAAARRASEAVASGRKRIGVCVEDVAEDVLLSEVEVVVVFVGADCKVDRCNSVGRWACAGEKEGLG